jgi:hypothetical protein
MPLFDIEYTAKSAEHQRQFIQVEAENIDDAIAAVQNYEIDNSDAIDLGHPIFSEWLVDDVKVYNPDQSPFGYATAGLSEETLEPTSKPLRFLVENIVFEKDGEEVDLPDQMIIEIPSSTPEDQFHDCVVEAASDRTGWLIESLQIFAIKEISKA